MGPSKVIQVSQSVVGGPIGQSKETGLITSMSTIEFARLLKMIINSKKRNVCT